MINPIVISKLGAAIQYFWPILVVQQQIAGITELSAFILVFIITSILLYHSTRHPWFTTTDDTKWTWVGTLSLVSLSLNTVLFCLDLTNIVTHILNPEYWALRSVMTMVK